jgi:precorrin-6A/cobalt-precorrin-6A reductase
MRVLILGGTGEASALARAIAADARFKATLSLAGRTRAPLPAPIPQRVGGFGGVSGLADYLIAERIAALVDATHPFAEQISRNAALAAGLAGVPLLRISRPRWKPDHGDRWRMVPDMASAAEALGPTPRRVFLTVGQKELFPFTTAPWHHYLIRSVEPPEPAALPAGAEVILARGPFAEPAERRLLARLRIEMLVTKNSGGEATAGKLRAARALGLPVIMVERPAETAAVQSVADPQAALEWLVRLHGTAARGV